MPALGCCQQYTPTHRRLAELAYASRSMGSRYRKRLRWAAALALLSVGLMGVGAGLIASTRNTAAPLPADEAPATHEARPESSPTVPNGNATGTTGATTPAPETAVVPSSPSSADNANEAGSDPTVVVSTADTTPLAYITAGTGLLSALASLIVALTALRARRQASEGRAPEQPEPELPKT